MKRPKVYISGPMSGLSPQVYVPRFQVAEEILRGRGYRVCNPIRLLPCTHPAVYRMIGYYPTLAYDILHLLSCDYIVYLPGYTQSRGCMIERRAARRFGVRRLLTVDCLTDRLVHDSVFDIIFNQ